MNEPHDPNVTADLPSSSVPPDSLDAGLAAGFGRPVAPRSSLGDLRPVLLKEAEGESSHIVKPTSDAMPPKEETGDRYRLDGEIARGGMGAVLRGRDVDLGRDLAVKVLLDKYADRPEVARRFIEEAQIAGQLQHPGVVPVYDIGRFGDRPFFTMKLVKGKTLAAILGEREQPADDRPRLLGIALQIAQTLAYAHAKGVIHRDLKPANIMVGAFGEVQVMDWGLAKVLAEGGIADEERASRAHQESEDVTHIRTARSGSTGFGTDTEAGSLLGTPAYMPPEQANGDIVNLDRRADVFGLGAILCEILTSKPPYLGRSGEEVRRKAANGDLADATARLDACGADTELIALTKACLAPEAIDRPKDAQAVADELTDYLNGVQERLHQAERERAVAVVREAEQRKKRKVQLALAVAVGGLMLGGGAFGWWQSEQTAERRLADERAATELARLEGERQAERSQRQLVDTQRAAADAARLARNAEAVAALVGQAEAALQGGDAKKAEVVLEAAKKRSAEGGAENEADRLKRLDADLALLRDLDAVDQFRWTWSENKYPDAAAVASRTRQALRQFGADPDATSLEDALARVSTSAVRDRIVSAMDRLLWWPASAGLRAVLRRVDADPFRDAVRDAVHANDHAKWVELVQRKAALEQPPGFTAFLADSPAISVDRRRQLLQAAVVRRPGDPSLLMALGGSYLGKEKEWLDERIRWYQAAIAVAPANYAAHINLGFTLQIKGQVDEAIACFRKAIELAPMSAQAHYNLAWSFASKTQWDEAIACCRKAIELDPKHARAHVNLGISLGAKGQVDVAIVCFRKAIELDPKNAGAHYNLGQMLRGKGQVDEAIACFNKVIEFDPTFVPVHVNLGIILGDVKRDYDGAIACFRKAIELDPRDPNAHCNLGQVLTLQGRFSESLAAYRRGHELGSKLPGWRYPSAEWVRRAEVMAAIEAKLPAFLKGELTPSDNAERLGLAGVCHAKKLHHAAAHLFAAAFAADPRLADDLKAGHRYNAARFASLAAAGQGEDAAKLDDAAKAKLRGQALDWLNADLALRTKQVETGKPAERTEVLQTMVQWQMLPDLATIRDATALAKLPADEQKAFTQLWADVAALLKKAEGKGRPGSPSGAKQADKTLDPAPPPREK